MQGAFRIRDRMTFRFAVWRTECTRARHTNGGSNTLRYFTPSNHEVPQSNRPRLLALAAIGGIVVAGIRLRGSPYPPT